MTKLPPPAPPMLASERPSEPEPAQPPWKCVYTIVNRKAGKQAWVRVGVAFVNRDGSLNVRLDALPTNGQLHIRDAPAPSEDPGPRGSELGHPGEG
jgi:hypothetical protein